MEKLLPDQNRMEVLSELEKKLSYRFRDITRLETALTHRSYVNENPHLTLADNERYEFLGDSVLGLCISDLLIKKYSDFTEGALSKVRAAVVNEKPLAELARRLDVGNCLLLGRGEEISGGRSKDSLLANALEAVIAAIYLDAGFSRTRSVLKKLMGFLLNDDSLQLQHHLDYKTALQEFCQKAFKTSPVYRIIDSSGPDHAKIFKVEVTVADHVTQFGNGKSKKEAEKQAAQKAWRELHNDEE